MTAVEVYNSLLFLRALERGDNLDYRGFIETEHESPVQDPASIAEETWLAEVVYPRNAGPKWTVRASARSLGSSVMPADRVDRLAAIRSRIVNAGNGAIDEGLPGSDTACRLGDCVRVFDPAAFTAALDEDDEWDDGGYIGPDHERPQSTPRSRPLEEETWARVMRKISADPHDGYRRLLIGDEAMALRLREATATLPHFSAVTGIIERAVRTSALAGIPVRFPPVLMVSEPGLGKTHYARVVGAALGTTAVSIALNATSDRGQLGGLSPAWRGAKLGRLVRTILFECETASPLFLLDEIDKCTTIAGENVSSILLSALETENAKSFTDEYIDQPVRLDQALWLASANVVESISPPLLTRLLVIEVPLPSKDQARIIVRSIAAAAVGCPLSEDAVELLLALSARKARQAIEIAYPFAACAGRTTISADDIRRALELVDGGRPRRSMGFMP